MVLCIGYFTVQPCDYWVTGLRLKDIFYPLLSAELWKVIQVESYGYTTIFLADSANLGTSFLVNMLVWVCLTTNLLCSSEYLSAATKLGQGNIFRSVCQEFCPRGGGCLPASPPRADPPPPPRADTHPPAYGQRAAGTHPTGMHSCCLCNLFRQFFFKIPGIIVICEGILNGLKCGNQDQVNLSLIFIVLGIRVTISGNMLQAQ